VTSCVLPYTSSVSHECSYLFLEEKPHDHWVNNSPLFQPKNTILKIIAYNSQTTVC
jgi:hypothetical protein